MGPKSFGTFFTLVRPRRGGGGHNWVGGGGGGGGGGGTIELGRERRNASSCPAQHASSE